MPPIAAVVATDEPEIAAKKVHATTDTREIPPEIQPTSVSANETKRFDRPPLAMMSPAKKKAGSASIAKLLQPANIFWVISDSDKLGSTLRATTIAPPNDQVTGMPITMRPAKVINIKIAARSMVLLLIVQSLKGITEIKHSCDS